jgi:hypothetical protein
LEVQDQPRPSPGRSKRPSPRLEKDDFKAKKSVLKVLWRLVQANWLSKGLFLGGVFQRPGGTVKKDLVSAKRWPIFLRSL